MAAVPADAIPYVNSKYCTYSMIIIIKDMSMMNTSQHRNSI